MPELPEMETYKALLSKKTAGRTITAVSVERPKSVNMTAQQFIEQVSGRTITGYDRRAKQLLFLLDDGRLMALHLMLGGWMFYGREEDKPDRTSQVILSFGENQLYFMGLRLGHLHLYTQDEANQVFAELGPEPTAPSFTVEAFAALLSSKRGALKTKLLDQSIIAGIGNCYSDELCHHAGIRPDRSIGGLSQADYAALYRSMHAVFEEAIQYGGYMENPLYVGDTLTGGYNDRCKVYDRENQPCYRCGQPIVKEMLNSRKMFYCSNCQR
ncbi:formamidopyrimidine-DNA glycosylase [Paenibacillus swuensis]|uniref:Formamidopyrimidine-DNA glycosylase n=1 Tax=Paenibacillus swuensis TaxID=1178515 RepID=A0A172TM22_9BACL|nr:DNA-formamidopyrimidine glycosylase [Paenibacillus swuensis]ANE47857.1 formamidopyrimidine-DNA glycosylase [Paenibacillus swuensis]